MMRKRMTIVMLSCLLLGIMCSCGSSSSSDAKESQVANSEATESENVVDIDAFEYDIDGDSVLLRRVDYSFKGDRVEINPTYQIDGKEYKTDLSDFQVGGSSDLKTVVFNEGITDIEHAVFNGCDASNIYFPKSISCVYDDTLSYLDHGDGTINIYFAGTEEEWNSIFTEYETKSVSEAEWGEEKGAALANKLNAMIGHEYDSGHFSFHFEG